MSKLELRPAGDDMYVIEAVEDGTSNRAIDFMKYLSLSRKEEDAGDFEKACNIRLKACQELADLIPDEGYTLLDWDDEQTQAAMTITYYSGIDHFLLGDWEMAAAIFEMLLDVDPEDHLEATVTLSYAYIAMGEYDSYDDIANDVNDKSADKAILELWSNFERGGVIDKGEFARFKKQFAQHHKEFTGDEHHVTEAYIADIKSDRPSKEAQARELWLQTEHIWSAFPKFIEALKNSR